MLSDNKTGLLTWGSRFVGSYFIEKYSLKYEIKIFSFLKCANIRKLDFYRLLHVLSFINIGLICYRNSLMFFHIFHPVESKIQSEIQKMQIFMS